MAKVNRKDNESLEALLRRFRAAVSMKNVQGNTILGSTRIKPLSRRLRKQQAIFLSNSKRRRKKEWLKV